MVISDDELVRSRLPVFEETLVAMSVVPVTAPEPSSGGSASASLLVDRRTEPPVERRRVAGSRPRLHSADQELCSCAGTRRDLPTCATRRRSGPRYAAFAVAAASADQQRESRHGLRVAPRVNELVPLAGEGADLLGQQEPDDLAASSNRSSLVAAGGRSMSVGRVLVRLPSGAQPEYEPSVRDAVQRGGHVRNHRGMAVGVAQDQRSQADPFVHPPRAAMTVHPSSMKPGASAPSAVAGMK